MNRVSPKVKKVLFWILIGCIGIGIGIGIIFLIQADFHYLPVHP